MKGRIIVEFPVRAILTFPDHWSAASIQEGVAGALGDMESQVNANMKHRVHFQEPTKITVEDTHQVLHDTKLPPFTQLLAELDRAQRAFNHEPLDGQEQDEQKYWEGYASAMDKVLRMCGFLTTVHETIITFIKDGLLRAAATLDRNSKEVLGQSLWTVVYVNPEGVPEIDVEHMRARDIADYMRAMVATRDQGRA